MIRRTLRVLRQSKAAAKYNALVENLRLYFIEEMGGTEQAFRLMLSTPSDDMHFLSTAELIDLGLAGSDPRLEMSGRS